MHGILLAAGAATRLPNKALMPIGDGKIAIESGLSLLAYNGCHPITIVVGPHSHIPSILEMRGWRLPLSFAVQSSPTGCMDAIRAANPKKRFCVAFCDNVYDYTERIPDEPCVSVRQVDNSQLDWWDPSAEGGRGRWKARPKPASALAFAGWAVMGPGMLQYGGPLVSVFNACGVKATLRADSSWRDIGTSEQYQFYLEDKIRAANDRQRPSYTSVQDGHGVPNAGPSI